MISLSISLFTYILLFILLLSAVLVILSKNPVYSAFYLICTFVFSVVFLLSLGVEFIAFVYLVVYVGAIAILFLFVVMMLNIKEYESNFSFIFAFMLNFLLILGFCFLLYLFDFYKLLTLFPFIFKLLSGDSFSSVVSINYEALNWFALFESKNSDIFTLGMLLFTQYSFCFILIGLIFLIVIVGAIDITVRLLPVHRQNTALQHKRSLVNSILLKS